MHDIKVSSLDFAELQALNTCLRSHLMEFGYSPKFLDSIAVAEEWLEDRQREFLRLKLVEEGKYSWGFRYLQIADEAKSLLRWGEDEEDLLFSIASFLEVKGNPQEALSLLEWDRRRRNR